MSTLHSIKQLLGVKDKNITILSCREAYYIGKNVNLAEAELVRMFRHCPCVKHPTKIWLKTASRSL